MRPALFRAFVAFVFLFLVGPTADVCAEAVPARHVRLTTPNGAIHVWTPRHYDAATAGVVVYVHGYYTTVDRAWREHRLRRQFAESGVNALYIACEAPRGPRSPLSWDRLEALLDAVEAGLGEDLPAGPRIAIGHSGAHRTLSAWLAGAGLDTLVLIDAVYGHLALVRDWINASDGRRLIDVSNLSRPWTDTLHASLPETVTYDGFPSPANGRLRGARTAKVVYVRSKVGHMPLITGGLALPMILRALRLPVVSGASRDAPIRTL